jgi:hypothetical protein
LTERGRACDNTLAVRCRSPAQLAQVRVKDQGHGYHPVALFTSAFYDSRTKRDEQHRVARPLAVPLYLDIVFLRGSATRLPVVEPPAIRALDRPLRAFGIVNTKAHAVAVAEIELGEVPMQVLFRAFHAALEDAEKPFDGVRAGAAPAVLLRRCATVRCSGNS